MKFIGIGDCPNEDDIDIGDYVHIDITGGSTVSASNMFEELYMESDG